MIDEVLKQWERHPMPGKWTRRAFARWHRYRRDMLANGAQFSGEEAARHHPDMLGGVKTWALWHQEAGLFARLCRPGTPPRQNLIRLPRRANP